MRCFLHSRVDNNDLGFNSLLQLFEKEKIDFSEIAVAIESPHQRVVDFLIARGVSVYPVNPKAVADYRKSRFPSGSKSDTADAQLLADYLREHHSHLRAALSQMALASLRCSLWSKGYFAKKRQEGKKAYHALRCLANAWLKVIFAIWKNEENYDETKHLASIARHQLKQPVAGIA